MHPILLASFLSVVVPVSSGASPSQQVTQAPAGSRVSVTLGFDITAPPTARNVVLMVLVPRSLPGRQKILAVRATPEPKKMFEKDGNRFALFVFPTLPQPQQVVIRVDAEVYRHDWATVSQNQEVRHHGNKEARQRRLIHEKYLEKDDPTIQQAAQALVGADEEQTIRNCFAFVLRTLKNRPFDDHDFGAVWALREKKGDCTEFADLFVALCRANGIPANTCEGYLLEPVTDTPKHDWAEVYSQKYGWVTFDPFYAYMKRDTTFDQMRPVYLQVEQQRSNRVLNNYHYYTYGFQGDGPVRVRDTFRVDERKDWQP
jgi:hypothetical protein